MLGRLSDLDEIGTTKTKRRWRKRLPWLFVYRCTDGVEVASNDDQSDCKTEERYERLTSAN